jgi:hypothetical protein
MVDEFRNFLMSEEADIIGYQIKDFNIIDSQLSTHKPIVF